MKPQILLFGVAMMLATGLSAETNTVVSPPAPEHQSALYTRILLFQNAQSLKKVKGLDSKKPLQQLVLDYLKQNGVELKSPSYAHLDVKKQMLTVHANNADLDKVGILIAKLDEKH